MLPIAESDWLEDFRIELSQPDIASLKADVDETLVFTRSRLAAALWLVVPGAAGYISGGLLAGPIWTSRLSAFLYLAVLPAVWLTLRGLTRHLLGTAIQWQALVLFFFTFIMGAGATLGAGFASRWWAYGISVGLALLCGLAYGALNPIAIRNKQLWFAGGWMLGPLSAFGATYLCRHFFDPLTLSGPAIATGVGGVIFAAPMTALLVRLWDNSRGLRHIGIICLHNDAFLRQSIECFGSAIALAPNDTGLLNLRGIAFSRLGETDRAEADWRRALELEPRSVAPLTNRGDALLREGLVAEAIIALESAVKADPKNGPANASLAIALATNGDLARAIQHCDRALHHDPRRPSTYAYRAQAKLNSGEFKGAIEDCNRALDIFPDFAMPYIVSGHAFARLGNSEKAIENYDAALEVAPDDDTANEARSALASLRTEKWANPNSY